MLTDALYMNAAWATPFDPNDTVPDSFTTATGQHVTANFMVNGAYRAIRADGWTAVWLPYRGGKLAMEALLPPAGAIRLRAAVRGRPHLHDLPPRSRPARPADQERRLPEGEPGHPG